MSEVINLTTWSEKRLAYHGVTALADGEHALLGRRSRLNLTFRTVG